MESTSHPLERAIAAELWRWSSLPETERSAVTSPRSPLAGAIEFYLCGAFDVRNSAPSSGWWCDGVAALSISRLAPTAFLVVGAAIWAKSAHRSPFYLAPFELEFHFRSTNDLEAQRIIVRFGSTDASGEIECVDYDAGPMRAVLHRPTRNQDWAFAVELT